MTEQGWYIEATKSTKHNIFSKPWNDSDVVLVVKGKEFHVHRFILSLQSPVFKAMFNGNFKDATLDKIELKDENHEAMLDFLKLLYPSNMLDDEYDDDKGEVGLNDENILQIVEVADKYGAKNVIKQCTKQAQNLKPQNTMRLLVYAERHDLPLEEIFDVITRQVSSKTLENFAPELGSNDSLYDQCLLRKCRLLENAAKQTETLVLYVLPKYLENFWGCERFATKCIYHKPLYAQDLTRAIKCEDCFISYMETFIDLSVYPFSYPGGSNDAELEAFRDGKIVIELLKLTDDIATSLEVKHALH